MSVLIFRLNGVSEEEAADVRELLQQHELSFYESTAGRWGISVAGLWLHDENQKHLARELIDQYQAEREQRFEYWWAQQPSFIVSLWRSFLARPIQFLAISVLLLAIIFISLSPFIHMAN